jgi:hypothetical protein
VTWFITGTISAAKSDTPQLGQHLAATVHTGSHCVYQPDPRVPIAGRRNGCNRHGHASYQQEAT